jgi:hypothetical protein
MAKSTASDLQDLARRIAQHEASLASLRGKLTARLEDLQRRRERLRAELRTVEEKIKAATPRSAPTEIPAPSKASGERQPVTPPASQASQSRTSLAKLLVRLVGEAKGKPLMPAELKQQVLRHGYKTSSANVRKLIENRVHTLTKQGRLRRDTATGGYVLTKMANGKATSSPTQREKTRPQGKTPRTSQSGRGGQPSLRRVVLDVLTTAGRTLQVQELAARVKKTGYRSKSKEFKNVLWTGLGQMPEVERDPAGGYRLKKKV